MSILTLGAALMGGHRSAIERWDAMGYVGSYRIGCVGLGGYGGRLMGLDWMSSWYHCRCDEKISGVWAEALGAWKCGAGGRVLFDKEAPPCRQMQGRLGEQAR